MEDRDSSQDTTVRGRQINVPHSTIPRNPNRHQPDTPPRKSKTAPAPVKKQRKPKKPQQPPED